MGGRGPETSNGGMFYNLVTNPTEPGSDAKFENLTNPEKVIGGGVLNFEVSGTTTIDGKFMGAGVQQKVQVDMTCVPIEESDQPVHLCSLIGVF